MAGPLDPNWGLRFGTDAPMGSPGLLAPQDQLRPYNPSPHEMLHQSITQMFGGGQSGARAADKVMSLIGLTPLQAPLSAYDAGRVLGGGLHRSDPAAIASGIGGIGLAGLQAAPLGLLGHVPALVKTAEPAEPGGAEGVLYYNPPDKPPRPFEADYPQGALADEQGRLTRDIEGRPLTARWAVGRRMVGGIDEAFPPTELDALAKEGTGRSLAIRPPREMEQVAGSTALNKYTGEPELVQLRSDLTPDQASRVLAHEDSHVIDELAGQLDNKGLMRELRDIYNTQNNPHRAEDGTGAAPGAKSFTPQDLGYSGDDVAREYAVEAIRAYLTNPNYIKTVAPRTAAAIRAAVNSNPRLSKIIQFNTIAAPAAGSLAQRSDQDQ